MDTGHSRSSQPHVVGSSSAQDSAHAEHQLCPPASYYKPLSGKMKSFCSKTKAFKPFWGGWDEQHASAASQPTNFPCHPKASRAAGRSTTKSLAHHRTDFLIKGRLRRSECRLPNPCSPKCAGGLWPTETPTSEERGACSQSMAASGDEFPEAVVVLSNSFQQSLPDCAGSESPHRFQRESLGREPGRSWERSGGSQSLRCQCHCPYRLGMEGLQTYRLEGRETQES